MRPILIRGGRVIDPSRGGDGIADLLLEGDRVAAVGRNIGEPDGALLIEAADSAAHPSTPPFAASAFSGAPPASR